MRLSTLLLVVLFGLAGCATKPPLSTSGVAKDLTPTAAVTRGEAATGQRVLWGGVILASSNLANATQLEVLAYPLEDNQQPKTGATPLGRFLVVEPGYLELADYAPGRRVTLVGPVTGTRQGRIGETDYTYPTVDPDKIQLWPIESARRDPDTRFHFGVGVIFH